MSDLKDIFEEATFYFCRLILLHPPRPLSLRRKGVPGEQREERKNDEGRDTKGVINAGGGGFGAK